MKTYGRAELVAKGWMVSDLAPHVAIDFKRLFPKARKDAIEHLLTDNERTCADLLWFMHRYPLEITAGHRAQLAAADQRLKDRLAELDTILSPTWSAPPVTGFKPGYAPYAYQTAAAQICLNMGGLLLADDVGLGKTITAAALLCMGAPMPAAVVVQAHLADQWAARLTTFTHLRVHIIRGTTPYTLPAADVYIWRYSNIAGWVDFLANGLIKTVIYDEIQELRGGTKTDKGRACAIVSGRAKIRLGLTATPTYNYGDENHTVMSFVMPGLLGTREEFLREWCGAGLMLKDPDALGAYLRETGHFLRRDENDPGVDSSLPPPNVLTTKVAWDASAVADEEALLRALALSVTTASSFMERGRAARELDLKMRQMTGIAKARSVAAYVRMLLRGGVKRVLLGGWHREVYSIWRKALADYEPVLYTGSETAAQKNWNVDQFTKGNSRVMMISLRSGAGLDGLQQHCQDLVVGEFDWSPQVHKQLLGRLRRPGQLGQVNLHNLWTDEGSDPVLIEMLGIKSDQSRGVLTPGQSTPVRVTEDSRIKMLARYVLEKDAPPAPPCELCEGPSSGEPRHIIPLSEAPHYPAGPERDALYGPENVWFLCDPCAAADQAAQG